MSNFWFGLGSLAGVALVIAVPTAVMLLDNWHKRYSWRKADEETRADYARRGIKISSGERD